MKSKEQCQEWEKIFLFAFKTDKDDVVVQMYVKVAVIKYQCVVTYICDIHLDNTSETEIKAIMQGVKEVVLKI